MPFREMIDPATGRVRVRYVDVTSELYQTLSAYMIRLTPEDLTDAERVRTLASAGSLSEAELVKRFASVVVPPTTVGVA